jgi:hypothetical protein
MPTADGGFITAGEPVTVVPRLGALGLGQLIPFRLWPVQGPDALLEVPIRARPYTGEYCPLALLGALVAAG